MGVDIHAALLAMVIVLVILIIAVLLCKFRLLTPDSFMPGDVATPKLRGTIEDFAADLGCVGSAGRRVLAASAADPTDPELAAAAMAVRGVVENSTRLQARIDTSRPTYQNVLAIYQGLAYSDRAILDASRAFGAQGRRFLENGHAAPENASKIPRVMAGYGLIQLSTAYSGLVRSVHSLGNALGLE